MEQMILSRAEFLWFEQHYTLRMCIEKAVEELIKEDWLYFADVCRLYDITVAEAKEAFIINWTNKLAKKVNYSV